MTDSTRLARHADYLDRCGRQTLATELRNALADYDPQPEAWPECTECSTPYVLRRCLSATQGWAWYWQRDCKHKGTKPRVAMEVVDE